VISMAAQILGHTQQGIQGMLCTERRPVLLPLMVYTGSELLEPRHVLVTQYNTVESVAVERGERQSRSVLPGRSRFALQRADASAAFEVFFSSYPWKNQRQTRRTYLASHQVRDQARCFVQLERQTTKQTTGSFLSCPYPCWQLTSAAPTALSPILS
jgi:hypothetical protein